MVYVSDLTAIHIVALTHQSLSFKALESPARISLHARAGVNAQMGAFCT